MTATSETTDREFKVWMTATLGLLKDGKMGASQARADRIKAAIAYTRQSRFRLIDLFLPAGVSFPT